MRRTVLLTALADWLPKLLAFLTVLLIARDLGASAFAAFAVALSWLGYAWWTVDLGQAGYSVRTLATTPEPLQQRSGSEIFSLYLTLAAIGSGLLIGLTLLTGAADSDEGRLLLWMSPYLLSYALFPDWWLRARGQLGALAAANWASGLVLLLCWVLVPDAQAEVYALAYGLSPVPGAVIGLAALQRAHVPPRWVPSWHAWTGHLRTSLLFGLAGLGGQISIPLALAGMSTSGSAAAVGAFALGMRTAATAANSLWLLLQNCLPGLMAATRQVSRLVTAATALPPAAAVLACGILWGPLLGPALGPSYAALGGYVALGGLLLVVWVPKYVVEIGLIRAFADRPRVLVNAVAPLVVLIALLLGLADERPWAMPVALLVGEVLAALLGSVLLRRASAGSGPAEPSVAEMA